MRRVKQSSLDRLNLMLGEEDLTVGLSIPTAQLELTEADLKFPCPLHAAESADPLSVRIDRVTRYGWCLNSRCSFSQGGSLLWLYSRALRQDISEVAEALAARKRVQLEYEFWIGDSTAPQTDSFVCVEAAGAGGAVEVVSAEELPAFVKMHAAGARSNPLRFEAGDAAEVRRRRREETLPLLGNLYAELRAPALPGARGSDEGLELALADARFLCQELMDRYRVPEEALALYFCAEGVHLEVDFRVLGAHPDPALARIYRRVAFLLGGVDEQAPARPLPGGGRGHPARCPTLIQDAYVHDFLWQCEGSRSGAHGLCKVWVSLHELMEKDARYLRELAREPRQPLDPPLRLSIERLARGLLICAQESVARGRELRVAALGDRTAGEGAPRRAAAAGVQQAAQAGGQARPGAASAATVVETRPRPAPSAPPGARQGPGAVSKEDRVDQSAGSSSAKAREGVRRAAPPGAPAAAAQAPVRAPAPAAQAAAGAPATAGHSAPDLAARLLSRDRLPISITAFGSKTHPGDGLNQTLQGGLHVGQVVGLVGATGEGKTTFALQLADGVAFDNLQRERDNQPTVPVLHLGGQARPEALLLKTLSRLGKLDSGDILRGKSQAKDLQEAMRVYQSFHRHMNVQEGGPDPDLSGLQRALDGVLGGHARAALVVVDPLTSLEPWETADGEATRRMCRRLGALSRECPIAVLAVIPCRNPGRGGPLDYVEEVAPLSEWLDVVLGLKTDVEIERAGGVMSLDERVSWKKEWKAELRRKADAAPLKRGGIDYRDMWKTEYSVLMTLKSRWQMPVHTAYYFHKAVHRFEEI